MNDQSDIGEELKKARQKRELSLEEVVHQTRIPLTTLRALEADDYSTFTSPAYAKSFLSQYSDFLRINADEVVENFNTGNIVTEPAHIEFLDQKNSQRHTPQPAVRSRRASSSQASGSQISQPLLILLITGGLLAAGIWGFITVEKRLNTTAETEIPASVAPSEPTPPVVQAPAIPAPVATLPPEPKEAPRPPRVITSIATLPTLPDEDPDAPVYVFPEHKAAPRAIIVNEDDDQ